MKGLCKRNDKQKGSNILEGWGEELAGQSFPIPLFRGIIWLNACNLNFSLGFVNHECSDSV